MRRGSSHRAFDVEAAASDRCRPPPGALQRGIPRTARTPDRAQVARREWRYRAPQLCFRIVESSNDSRMDEASAGQQHHRRGGLRNPSNRGGAEGRRLTTHTTIIRMNGAPTVGSEGGSHRRAGNLTHWLIHTTPDQRPILGRCHLVRKLPRSARYMPLKDDHQDYY